MVVLFDLKNNFITINHPFFCLKSLIIKVMVLFIENKKHAKIQKFMLIAGKILSLHALILY